MVITKFTIFKWIGCNMSTSIQIVSQIVEPILDLLNIIPADVRVTGHHEPNPPQLNTTFML